MKLPCVLSRHYCTHRLSFTSVTTNQWFLSKPQTGGRLLHGGLVEYWADCHSCLATVQSFRRRKMDWHSQKDLRGNVSARPCSSTHTAAKQQSAWTSGLGELGKEPPGAQRERRKRDVSPTTEDNSNEFHLFFSFSEFPFWYPPPPPHQPTHLLSWASSWL